MGALCREARLLCMKRGRGSHESEVLAGVRFGLLLLPLFELRQDRDGCIEKRHTRRDRWRCDTGAFYGEARLLCMKRASF